MSVESVAEGRCVAVNNGNSPVYRQSAVVPFRFETGSPKLMIITNVQGKRWIFPKGLVEQDMTAADSALREAYEEAGIEGAVLPGSVGSYTYEKWGGTCEVEVFLMRVENVLDEWPESEWRQRKWVSPDEARTVIDERIPRTVIDSIPATEPAS